MSAPGINFYDIRKTCQGPLCYDFSDADAFLNSAAVRKALGINDNTHWQECNMLVNAQFYGGCQGLVLGMFWRVRRRMWHRLRVMREPGCWMPCASVPRRYVASAAIFGHVPCR